MKKLLLALFFAIAFAFPAFAAVNINTATQSELETLKGIGPAKAKAIIEYRQKNGNFKTVDDITGVKGIGDKTLAKLRPDLSISGTTTAPAAKATDKPASKEDKPAKAEKASKK